MTSPNFIFASVTYVYAQRFPTNNVSQEQAIRRASRLWVGMSPTEVEKIKHLGKTWDVLEIGSLLDVLRSDQPVSFRKRFHPKQSRVGHD
jgi:hypothetical protein